MIESELNIYSSLLEAMALLEEIHKPPASTWALGT